MTAEDSMSDVREIFAPRAAWLTCACAAVLAAFPARAPAAPAQTPALPAPASAERPASPSQGGLVAVAGFTYVKSLAGIDEYRLHAKGLPLPLVPDHSPPRVG